VEIRAQEVSPSQRQRNPGDLHGALWYNHFNDNAIGRLDLKTGQTKEWRWPYRAKQGSFAPTGARTMMGPDKQNRFYIGNQEQGGLVKTIKGSRPLARYDIASDTQNNLFGSGRGSTYVWYANAKTGEVSYFDIPATPRGEGGLGGGMRRGKADKQDRLWWGGFDGNFVGMLDPKQPAGRQMKLWAVPFPWFFPYDAHYDEQGYTWTGGIYADRVARLHLDSGEWNFYLLPFTANIRDIDLKPAASGGLSGLWIGHNHQGLITLIEPLSK
jgi:streptogramin lyase